MPTATSTLISTTPTVPAVISIKASLPSPLSSTSATLRSLYPRAARAFLHREVPLAHTLLTSAFAILHPPSSASPDTLAVHRRKWDILRITLETTVYASPPLARDLEVLPTPLRANLVHSPQTLIASLYTRSLNLFTPTSPPQKPNATFLPSQILVTLILSSLKLNCAHVGKGMLEEWLARRGQYDGVDNDNEGYQKVVDIYCLYLLPRLEQWDYAREFLQNEEELPPEYKERLKSTLATLHSQALLSQRPSSPSRSPSRSSASTPRVVSPAPSTSSSSSSLSTTSTHTVVPRTCPTALSAASQSTTSTSSNSTITQRTDATKSKGANGHAIAHRHRPGNRDRDPDTMPGARALSDARRVSPSAYTLIKASLGPYLTTSNLTTFLILFIVFPLLSFVLRVRRRKLRASAENPTTGSTANQVRRRLGATGNWGLIGKLWQEVVRSVGDTIRMGGQGLV